MVFLYYINFLLKLLNKYFYFYFFSLMFLVSFIFFLTNFNYLLFYYILYKYFIVYPNFSFFGLFLLFIALYFSFLIVVLAENKIAKTYKYIFLLLTFPLVSLGYIYTNNIIIFFFFYELFLVPSIYLVYYLSPNKRSLIAVFYFLIWTQLGSFLVFLFLILLLIKGNTWLFNELVYIYLSHTSKKFLFFLLFFGFGIKIPIWPFYYWLTKTHVEAPTFFSIYLSGFLVKTALYGFYKLFFFLIFDNLYIYYTILLFGVCDVSLKFFCQVDLKKLVAYSTVQEMNLIYIGLLWGSKKSMLYVSFFSLIHALLSTMFFFIIDILYKRYYSRTIYNISSVFLNYPTISLTLILLCFNYNGFPCSLKFFVEIFFFYMLFEINAFSTLLVLIILNWFGTINFTYLWFRTLFGNNSSFFDIYNLDMTKKEILIFWTTFFIFYQFIFFIYLIF